jgi:hypothetical protein
MDWVIATGSICLGILLGALVGWFVSEAKAMDYRILSSSVGILTGGGVLALFGFLSKGSLREIWLYPVGLLLGFVAVTILELRYYDYYGKERPRKKAKNSN